MSSRLLVDSVGQTPPCACASWVCPYKPARKSTSRQSRPDWRWNARVDHISSTLPQSYRALKWPHLGMAVGIGRGRLNQTCRGRSKAQHDEYLDNIKNNTYQVSETTNLVVQESPPINMFACVLASLPNLVRTRCSILAWHFLVFDLLMHGLWKQYRAALPPWAQIFHLLREG